MKNRKETSGRERKMRKKKKSYKATKVDINDTSNTRFTRFLHKLQFTYSVTHLMKNDSVHSPPPPSSRCQYSDRPNSPVSPQAHQTPQKAQAAQGASGPMQGQIQDYSPDPTLIPQTLRSPGCSPKGQAQPQLEQAEVKV